MPSERLALYTTVYPGVERFLPDWYESVQAQTDGDFDIWIGLDGLAPAAVSAIIGAETGIHWVPAPTGASPARVRAVAIEAMVTRYSGVLFVDSDDVLLPTRGAAARTALAEADVAGCALELMDANGTTLDAILGVPASSDAVAMLPRCNVFGLSNTVYRSDVLRGCLPLPDDCILVDWFLATRAWAGGATLAFDPVPRMRYRQHDANIAPLLPPFTPVQIATATGRVLDHYRCLLDREWRSSEGHRTVLEHARERALAFASAMREDPGLLETYAERLNSLSGGTAWWWQVAHPALEALWMN